MAEALNRFFKHTDLPINSGGSEDPALLYQRQTALEELSDWPKTDRVYKNPTTARYFKLRAGKNAGAQGLKMGDLAMLITVAQCDADGWAMEWEGGPLPIKLAEPQTVLVPKDDPRGALVALESEYLRQVAMAELAVENEEIAGQIPLYETPPQAEETPLN